MENREKIDQEKLQKIRTDFMEEVDDCNSAEQKALFDCIRGSMIERNEEIIKGIQQDIESKRKGIDEDQGRKDEFESVNEFLREGLK